MRHYILLLLIVIGCNKKTEKSQDGSTDNIELLRFYIENNGKRVIEDNGISHALSFKISEISRDKIFVSETITMENNTTIDVGSYKANVQITLIDNGEIVREIKYTAFLFEIKQIDQYREEFWKSAFCSKAVGYIPELDGLVNFNDFHYGYHFVQNKKELIMEFTGGNCGMGEVINNQVNKMAISAIKSTPVIDN